MKVQRVDKGYPRATDDVFTGVPLDARNVFLYQGEWNLVGGCCGFRPGLPEPLMALLRFLARDARVWGPQDRGAISPGGSLWWSWQGASKVQGAMCLCCLGSSQDGSLYGQTSAEPPFPPPPSLPRQVPLLPGQLLLEDDTALPGGQGGLRQV